MIELTIVDFLPPQANSWFEFDDDRTILFLTGDFHWVPKNVSGHGKFECPVECFLSQSEFQNQLPQMISPLKEKKDIGTVCLVVRICDESLISFGMFFCPDADMGEDNEEAEVKILRTIDHHVRSQKLESFR